jgi:hypothetical protein
MPYCFRVRFEFGPRARINIDEKELRLPDAVEGKEVVLKAGNGAPSLAEAKSVVLRGQLFDTECAAVEAAERWAVILKKALARNYAAGDFGGRAPSSGITEHGIRYLTDQQGRRVLEDVHGISAFDPDPLPLLVRVGPSEIVVGPDAAHLLPEITAAADLRVVMSSQEELAYDLWAASFSEDSEDARFMMLMMALETLIDPAERSDEVRGHVNKLIATTKESDLPNDQVASVTGSLEGLLKESIGQAGRKLASKLDDRAYMTETETPRQFFTKCYALRSTLAHGHDPRPPREEVGVRAASLEHFVADLLTLEFPVAQ